MQETIEQQPVANYHRHVNYIKIWAILLVLLIVSLIVGMIGYQFFAVWMIFTIAVVKALMVVAYYMHLLWEPKFLWLAVGFAVLCLFFLFLGVVPDILLVKLQLAH
ncbi:MAG: cytochrome C oxidase subunit IV family protein [Lentisphaeria bacterium]|jgi:caa(3)-type oxidase subunit IV|nr:cytochrome C oxidase subunit IV family protein [Lentisphaeria bacterium]MDP7743282.1 cytochrome C oxidase subunit IV family protein [Lentisphaeria bacterium]